MSEEIKTIRGHRVDFDNKRAVFLGHLKGDDTNYVKFFNGDQVIALRISSEAIQALARLDRGNLKNAKRMHDKLVIKEPEPRWVCLNDGDDMLMRLEDDAPAKKKARTAALAAGSTELINKISKRIAKKLPPAKKKPRKRKS